MDFVFIFVEAIAYTHGIYEYTKGIYLNPISRISLSLKIIFWDID